MSRPTLLRALAALIVVGAAAAAWLALGGRAADPAALGAALDSLGAWAPVLFVVLYAAATLAFLPGSVFALAAGALFGAMWGPVLALAGATAGATGAFLLARTVAAGWVRRKAGPRLERFISGVEAEGWRFVAFVRLVPLFPFNLTNYALGLTRIPLAAYVLASLVCMIPGTLAYTWLGHAGREAVAGDATAIRYGLAALGLLAAIAFLPRLIRRLRGARPSWIEPDELALRLAEDNVTLIDVREPDELAGPLGRIAAAANLPLGEIPGRLTDIAAREDRPVVLVCRTDRRSARAAALLRDAGLRDVHVLRGGMERWRQENRAA